MPVNSADMRTPLLAVVIIGLNEEERIVSCIRNVRRAVAGIPATEIVYVDSRSTDGTASAALGEGARVYVLGPAQPPSPAAGRFVGTRETNSKYLLFVDGDTSVAAGWIEDAIARMEPAPAIVMCAGDLGFDPAMREELPPVKGLGELQPVCRLGGGWAPVVARAALLKAGNWNPFVRAREEEDLAIRLRRSIPGAKIMRGNACTVVSRPIVPNTPSGYMRRWKRGFNKGAGQVLRNALAQGYMWDALPMAYPIILLTTFLGGLGISLLTGHHWLFLVVFFAAVVLRAVITGKLVRIPTVFYSLLSGVWGLIEVLSVPPRTAEDYVCDYTEIEARSPE